MDYRQSPPNAPLLVFGTSVIAMDRDTGRQLWSYSTDEEVVRRFLIDGERLFVFDAKSIMHCIALATGQRIGAVRLGLEFPGSMLADGGRIYVSGDKEVVALDSEGRILWRSAMLTAGWSLVGLAVPGGNQTQPDFSTS